MRDAVCSHYNILTFMVGKLCSFTSAFDTMGQTWLQQLMPPLFSVSAQPGIERIL